MGRNFVAASSQKLTVASAIKTAVPLSMSCIFRSTSGASSQGLMFLYNSSNDINHFGLTLSSGPGTVQARCRSATTESNAVTTANWSASGAWQQAGGIWTATNGRSAWLNGANSGTASGTVSPSGINAFDIGQLRGLFMNGDIAEAAVWGVGLVANDMAALGKFICPLLVQPASILAY